MRNTEVSTDLTSLDSPEWLHVVAAVIIRNDHSILLACRPLDKHQGGKWEFPGGKVEGNEQAPEALVRELEEELGILADPLALESFIEIRHSYPEKNIFLDVWQVSDFTGEPHGREGQEVKWFQLRELAQLVFPEANAPIIDALLAKHC